MMLFPLFTDFPHFFIDLFVLFENIEQLFTRDDEELAADVCNCGRISDVLLIFHKDIWIAEVRALYVEVERYKNGLAHMILI